MKNWPDLSVSHGLKGGGIYNGEVEGGPHQPAPAVERFFVVFCVVSVFVIARGFLGFGILGLRSPGRLGGGPERGGGEQGLCWLKLREFVPGFVHFAAHLRDDVRTGGASGLSPPFREGAGRLRFCLPP